MERIHEKIEIEADVPAAPKSDIIETFNCPICGEDQSVFKLFSFDGCGHTYCTDCLKEYLHTKIKEADCIDIHCPAPKCKTPVTYSEIQMLVDKAYFSKYEEFSLQGALKADSNVRWCPKPGCGIPLFGDPSEPHMRCACGHEYCFKCLEDWHEGTCEQYQKWKEENKMVDKKYEKWAKKNTKPCPKCKAKIQKNEGCNHMTCYNCHYEFCWLCGGQYTPNHFDLLNMFGCPGMQSQGKERYGVIRRHLWKGLIASALILGSVLVFAAGAAMPGNIGSSHSVVKVVNKTWKRSMEEVENEN